MTASNYSSNISRRVNRRLSRRQWLAGFVAAVTVPQFKGLAAPKSQGPITPEQFGAIGDGQTNDTAAFADMTSYINRNGGGEISLRPTTYIVGQQASGHKGGYAFLPTSIMEFVGLTAPLVIRGNGARIRCADGLRYGTFDPRTGEPTQHPLPYYGTGEISSPYFAMLSLTGCAGQVVISDLELDGNVAGIQIGGRWGDTGWQIGCCGLKLQDNKAPVQVVNVKSHHHAQDGGIGNGLGTPGYPEYVSLENCEFVSNGRNGWSMVGGVGWTFTNCRFDESARSLPFPGSAPKAGIDFEAEGGKYVRDIRLVNCTAEHNVGVGCLHPGAAKSSNVSWEGGKISGTTAWSYFGGGNEGIIFKSVIFLGALVNLTKESFENCTFSNDISQSPIGALHNPSGFIIPDCEANNRFSACLIVHTKPERSINGSFDQAKFENCVFQSAAGAGRLDIYGHFSGTETHFTAGNGGTDFGVTPDALGGWTNAGGADDPFSITKADGTTTIYSPTSA